MPKFTPQQLDELYHQTLAEFAASPEKWTSFLDTAARLYKYDFKSQVLIWSQRPDATACAELPLWNDRLHRRISGRCGTMHTIQFWTVSLPHWARICRPILISLLTCICPPSALQIRKPVNTLTTPI